MWSNLFCYNQQPYSLGKTSCNVANFITSQFFLIYLQLVSNPLHCAVLLFRESTALYDWRGFALLNLMLPTTSRVHCIHLTNVYARMHLHKHATPPIYEPALVFSKSSKQIAAAQLPSPFPQFHKSCFHWKFFFNSLCSRILPMAMAICHIAMPTYCQISILPYCIVFSSIIILKF